MTLSIALLLAFIALHDAQYLSQSYVQISDIGEAFQPLNSIELLGIHSASSFIHCSSACNLNILCRTFDYDASSLRCRLFEGAFSTGHVVPTASTSRIGSVKYFPMFFTNFGQPCSPSTESRYLACSNNTLQCPPHSYWSVSQCRNQRYENASCSHDDWCRNDPFGLTCSASSICENSNATTTATSATTVTTVTTTTTSCPNTTCSFNASAVTVGPGYQYERLYLNCSSSLTNYNLVHVVQRHNNETYYQQYETFWAVAINKTYVQTSSVITFTWHSVLGGIVNASTYPLYTEGQFYYNANGPTRSTQNDTWALTAQSLCGSPVNYSGTF